MKRIVKFLKDFLLFFPATYLFRPFSRMFLFLSYFNQLVVWISRNKKEFLSSDHYSPVRDYSKRYQLYSFITEHYKQSPREIVYLEFGVAGGTSFRWWMEHNKNAQSRFLVLIHLKDCLKNGAASMKRVICRLPCPRSLTREGKIYQRPFPEQFTGIYPRKAAISSIPVRKK
jgi:hypothetical protein